MLGAGRWVPKSGRRRADEGDRGERVGELANGERDSEGGVCGERAAGAPRGWGALDPRGIGLVTGER